jgi:hypothetical protein
MTRADLERLLHRSGWPEPTVDLRARVLAVAPPVHHRVTWSDRIWFSRAWRIAAAAAVVSAIAIESLPGSSDRTAFVAPPQAAAEAQVIDATGREMGFPPNVTQALARRAVAMAAHPPADRQSSLTLQDLQAGGR